MVTGEHSFSISVKEGFLKVFCCRIIKVNKAYKDNVISGMSRKYLC
jgi:hypothetical protein